jgi:shikimate dehydrogenase
MTGGDFAIYQAADAFELFTELKPSIIEMGNAFDGAIAKAGIRTKQVAPRGSW